MKNSHYFCKQEENQQQVDSPHFDSTQSGNVRPMTGNAPLGTFPLRTFLRTFFQLFLIQNLPVGFEIYLESTQSGNVRPMTGNALLGKGCTHDLRGHSCSKLKSHISNKISWQYCGKKVKVLQATTVTTF